MKSRIFGLLSCFVLVASLLGGLSFTQGVSAAPQVSNPASSPAAPLAVTNGGLPNLITIPFSTAQVTVDGTCNLSEYSGSSGYSFFDGLDVFSNSSGTVSLQTDGEFLYVCLVSSLGTYPDRFASLYLDPQGNGSSYTFAQQDDFSLRIKFTDSTRTSMRGNGLPNGYTLDGNVNDLWSGAASTGKYDQAEYKIPLKKFNINPCYGIFGMAVYHHWFADVGNDYGWPSNQWFDQPRTWQLVTLGGRGCTPGNSGNVAYVYRGNTLDASSYYSLLQGAGYTVTLVPLADILTTDFKLFDLILIADDTGSLNQWGSTGLTAAQVARIANPDPGNPVKPIIGLGEGGYAFFGQLSMFIGWPQGWHGPQEKINRTAFSGPYFTGVLTPTDPVPHYLAPNNSVGIFLPPAGVPADVVPLGMEDPPNQHSSLISQNCRWLWGNSGNPLSMTGDGKTIFLNTVHEARNFQCQAIPQPPTAPCYTITKGVAPTGTVLPGAVLTYTLSYNFTGNADCPTQAKLVDIVPPGTNYVPDSASDGISPAADGSLTWLVAAGDPAPQQKTFKVIVTDQVCAANKIVSNYAELRPSGFSPKASDPVTNPVTCPNIGFPNHEPMYAETELKVDPYPLVTGVRTKVSVRVANLTSLPQPVTVQFQSSPARFGIGLAYTTFATTSGIVPASGSAVLTAQFIPTFSGNACIQAAVSAAGLANPLITQTCLDVTEDLTPGVSATLTFPVHNSTSTSMNVNLVVDNTCPGWTAAITDPAGGALGTVNPGDSPLVTLTVTPPSSGPLGSGCHIDVQAWDTTTPTHPVLIGGIRKLDVPPVHLPVDVQPPWEEPEITFIPDPPLAGSPAQLCIQLINPLSTSKTVTVDFAVADFGAGIGFTPITTLTVTLPANSIGTYCANWTPAASGTLHRCVLVTLKQLNYQDQHSQRNVTLRTPSPGSASLVIPFIVGNPDLVGHTLGFQTNLVGINPAWQPVIELPGGGSPPATIPGGAHFTLQLRWTGPILSAAAAQPLLDLTLGSQHSVEVTLLLDGVPSGGFTIQLVPNLIFLPSVKK